MLNFNATRSAKLFHIVFAQIFLKLSINTSRSDGGNSYQD